MDGGEERDLAALFASLEPDEHPEMPPDVARVEGGWWLVLEKERYAAEHGEEALEALLDELRARGIEERPYTAREGVWVSGPRPPADFFNRWSDYLHPPSGLPPGHKRTATVEIVVYEDHPADAASATAADDDADAHADARDAAGGAVGDGGGASAGQL